MADSIDKLPVDDTPVDQFEMTTLNAYFKPEVANKILSLTTREVLIAGSVFAVISLPVIDNLFTRFFPITKNSVYFNILLKTIAFIIVLFVVSNLALAKKA